MCECMLSDTLEGKIQVNSLLKWLVSRKVEGDNLGELEGKKCFQGDFISYFLNFIHDTQTYVDKNGETPQKTSTPKRIEQLKHHDNESPTNPVVRRRQALFENIDATHQIAADTSTNTPHSFIQSTPKVVRNNLNESYASPLSPLYNRQNFTTPKDKYYAQPSPRTTPSLCLGDFITHSKTSSKKKAQRNLNENIFNSEELSNSTVNLKARRINPTNLMQRKFNSSNFKKSDNSFTFKNGTEEIVDNSNGQRSFLVEERMKIVSRRTSVDTLPVMAVPKTFVMSRKKEVTPLFNLVTFRQQLDVLVLIYNFMLDNNFVLNFTSEFYFIVSLLLSREYEEVNSISPNSSLNLGITPLIDNNDFHTSENCDSKFSNTVLFKTIHNRIYFASKILQNQTEILKILDRPTLRLLIENKRLKQFSLATFSSDLLQIYEQKAERSTEISEQGIQSNVCFISDTDNRDNFPNDPSFHAFRKQRDLFYETLRIWENNHLQDEWNFVVALGGKIKALLNMYPDAANLVHFARLFKAQLLMNTCVKNEEDNIVGENQLSFLSSIPNIDAEKLSRLKSRIVGKQTGSGINSIPTFSGYQEFYHDFVLVAANHMFNRHLNDALVLEIVDLNNTKFSCSDFDDTDALVDSSTQNSYTLCIKSLRILAKFLGFLESLPYKSDCPQLPQNVVACQIRIRNEVQPSMNLKDILRKSIRNNNLILTIPWTTKYLAMLDYVTLRLPYFEDVFHMLFEVYYYCSSHTETNDKHKFINFNHKQNVFLIKLCLGWLFELPHFPEDSYYAWLSQKLSTKQKFNLVNCCASPENAKVQRKSPKKNVRLDELDIVDQSVLYICCPYLQEIKKILSNDASTSNNTNVTIKHITPLTAVQSPTDLSNKRLQLQLEEAFFNGQQVSIRKTVEFISERVASACVKQICNEIVPLYKKKALVQLKEILNSFDVSELMDEDESARLKLTINTATGKFASLSLKELREQIDNELKSMGSIRISTAVESLLAADVLKQTKDVCVTIATRTCLERVQQWINSHVNIGIFTKDFDAEVKQLFTNRVGKNTKVKPVFALPGFGKNMQHNESALSGVEVVESVRGYSWKILENPNNVTLDTIADLLGSVYQSIKQRCDLNDCILTLINKMLVDLSLLLIAHRPDVMSDGTSITKLCQIWRESGCNCDDLFKNLVCPRNITLLSQSSISEISWKSFHRFISILLSENLLTCDVFEAQVAALDKQILDEVTLKHLSTCLQEVVNDYIKTDGKQRKFALILSFLSE